MTFGLYSEETAAHVKKPSLFNEAIAGTVMAVGWGKYHAQT